MPPSKSLISLCSHLTHYFKVNCKTSHLAIIDNTICQSDKTDETSDNYPHCPLNIFILGKWLTSLTNGVENSNLKRFSTINK